MSKYKIQNGSTVAPDNFRIVVMSKGPYMVYGNPPLRQQFIMTDSLGNSRYFKEGHSFSMKTEPTALCRCGESKSKPYCDGTHVHATWSPELTADMNPLLKNVEVFEGPVVSLTDNEKYCAFARFCDAQGRAWNLVERTDEHSTALVISESNHCPGGRLSVWNNKTGEPFEPELKVSLGLIEDPSMLSSGPLWVCGGIPISKETGESYEVRNRVTLCRCGQSSNKPFCDGTHASMKFDDELGGTPDGTEF